jgi:hypothetical protein
LQVRVLPGALAAIVAGRRAGKVLSREVAALVQALHSAR